MTTNAPGKSGQHKQHEQPGDHAPRQQGQHEQQWNPGQQTQPHMDPSNLSGTAHKETEANSTEPASYLNAAHRTREFFNSPLRLGTVVVAMAGIGSILALLEANILDSWWWLAPIAIVFVIIYLTGGMSNASPASNNTSPAVFSEPARPNPNDISWSSSIGFLIFFPSLFIISMVAESISNSAALYPVVIGLSIISAAATVLPSSFGFFPLAKPLPTNFAERLPYPAHSPEARVLAVLETANLRKDYVFFTDPLPYFALLDDGQLLPTLTTLEADGYVTVTKNRSTLTEKGRARKFVQLTNTAPAA